MDLGNRGGGIGDFFLAFQVHANLGEQKGRIPKAKNDRVRSVNFDRKISTTHRDLESTV